MAERAPNAKEELAGLGEHFLHLGMAASPFTATLLGIPGYDDRVPDVTPEATEAQVRELRELIGRAGALTGLDAADELTREVLVHQARDEADQAELRQVEFATAPFWASAHSQVLSLMPKVRLTDAGRAAAYLERLRAVPGYLDSACEQLRAGTAKGRLPARRSLSRSIQALDLYLSAPEGDPLLAPAWSDPDWQTARAELVRDEVRPAMARMRAVYQDELLERSRPDDQVGLSRLPGGAEMYRVLARASTTTSRTPEELHALGHEVLEQLDEEYAEIGGRLFGLTGTQAVLERMRNDPGLRLRDADDLLTRSRTALERANAELPKWFGLLPRAECDLQLVPPAEAPTAAPAYYSPADDSTGRPGTYWVNAHEVAQRPVYDVESIAFHEAVPGHHLQFAVSQQCSDLPLFRRVQVIAGYNEGWGLYSERLADEMGLYSGDLGRLGMLSCDSWRACRLVVDTGLHALGWSFEQAVTFMHQRSPVPLSVIEPEVDRYVGLPGQALSYMVGRLELQRMRRAAEDRLGPRFDIRAFHDTVLGGGALPLAVLDGQVQRWVQGAA